jgi:hypothetical protein
MIHHDNDCILTHHNCTDNHHAENQNLNLRSQSSTTTSALYQPNDDDRAHHPLA